MSPENFNILRPFLREHVTGSSLLRCNAVERCHEVLFDQPPLLEREDDSRRPDLRGVFRFGSQLAPR
jgi:hypothetical protein